jgi:phosphate transport system protein
MTDSTPSTGLRDEQDREIRRLKEHLAEMGTLAVGMVADGTRAFLDGDGELKRSVIARDAPLDRYDLDIEAEAIRLVATMQPEGLDLRTIEAVIKIANCVDRAGRLGYDIARSATSGATAGDPTRPLLKAMDEKARAMVTDALAAFQQRDAPAAKAVLVRDDEVDALHRELQAKIVEMLRAGGPPADRLAFELLACRHLERVADNGAKIAEKAVYAITGERRSEYFPPRRARP